MDEREDRTNQGYERRNIPINPFDRMNNFVRERTQGFDQLEIGNFQRFGQINVRIALLEEQRRLNRGAVEYLLGNGSSIPLSVMIVNPLEIEAWIDILGKVANSIDKAYFRTTEDQAVSAEILEFSKVK